MASEMNRTRPGWFWFLVAFLIGLLVGWLVIGWALWPVNWKNTLPQDLRPAERDEYLMMVAESLATNDDTALAQQRLQAWPRDELAADLKRLYDRAAAENGARVPEVQALAAALGVDLAAEQPAVATSPSTPGSSLSPVPWRSIWTAALWVVLVLLGLAAIAWLYSRWRGTQVREPKRTTDVTERSAREWAEEGAALSAAQTPEDTRGTWIEEKDKEALGGSNQPLTTSATSSGRFVLDEEEPPRTPSRPVSAAVPVAVSRTSGVPVAGGPLVKVGDFRAAYQTGEPDYDEAFTVTDSTGAYVGECGVALEDPIGHARDQAAALQVWLYDRSDPDTKVRVLMGEGAYRDTALRDQLAGEHTAIAVRPGTEFELDSYNLLLRGTVEKLDYVDQEPAYGVFAELLLHLQVYRKEQ